MAGNPVHLSLSAAIRSGALSEFTAQEEARGVGPVDQQDLDAALARVIKDGQSEDQTSHSHAGGGSSGK